MHFGCVWPDVNYFPSVKYFQVKIFLRKENIFKFWLSALLKVRPFPGNVLIKHPLVWQRWHCFEKKKKKKHKHKAPIENAHKYHAYKKNEIFLSP